MKKYKTALIVLGILYGTGTSFAQGSLQDKIILKSPSMVSQEAEQNSFSGPSELESNPFLNGYMGAVSNMLNNNTTSPYYLQEQQKQQAEYVKQKVDN